MVSSKEDFGGIYPISGITTNGLSFSFSPVIFALNSALTTPAFFTTSFLTTIAPTFTAPKSITYRLHPRFEYFPITLSLKTRPSLSPCASSITVPIMTVASWRRNEMVNLVRDLGGKMPSEGDMVKIVCFHLKGMGKVLGFSMVKG